MPYEVWFSTAVRRDLKPLPASLRARLVARTEALADEPRPRGALKLAGNEERYRIRAADYPIIYEVHDDILLVLVMRLGRPASVALYER